MSSGAGMLNNKADVCKHKQLVYAESLALAGGEPGGNGKICPCATVSFSPLFELSPWFEVSAPL